MAKSNASLIEEIKALDDTAVTDGLKNNGLEALLKTLKAAAEDEELEDEELEDEELEDEELEDESEYYVADGKSVTSLRGIRAPGTQVEAKYFPGGQETLDNLIERGTVVKR